MILHLHAKPGARRSELLPAGPDGRQVVRLAAPAHEGQANAELLRFLAAHFGVSKSSVRLLNGHTSPFKKVEVAESNE